MTQNDCGFYVKMIVAFMKKSQVINVKITTSKEKEDALRVR
jgi:hypothetical protein